VRITERKTGGPLETIPISGNLNFAHDDADLWTEGVYLYTCTIETVRIRKEKEQFPEM